MNRKIQIMSKHRCNIGIVSALAASCLVLATSGQRATAADGAPPTSFKFAFGPGKAPAGFTQVLPDMTYSKERGFGFEAGADLKASGANAARGSISSDKPFFFSVAVPEGNYKVTATLGEAQAATDNTVNAELRRLMLERVQTAPGKFETRSFIVNVRTPAIVGGGEVRLGAREKTSEIRAWDDRLSLEFNGAHPGVAALEIAKVDVPTVYLLGDSTVCDQPREPFNSWGQMLTRFLKPDVAVCNGAESGDSIAPALGARRFDKFWSQMKSGDYLFIQFGHNDMKSTATNALGTYANNMRRAVDETRKHGGIPVLVTSVSRRTFDDQGKITDSFKGFTQAVREVAKEKNAPLVDLQNMAAAFYEALGVEKSHQAFATPTEGTHHNDYGSYEVAKCVLMGIKQNKLDLAKHIVDDFKDFDPSHPDAVEDFKVPKSPQVTNLTPLGN
jgi:lysophospholipase L1-like esterase